MNYTTLIVALLLGVFYLDCLADILNLRRLQGELPDEFKGIYDPTKYATSLQYQKDSVYSDLLSRTFFLVGTLIFFGMGGFFLMDAVARMYNYGTIGTGLIYIGILTAIRTVFQIPFSLYDTFYLEAKYGLNKMSFKTFLSDLVKSLVLSVVIGAPIIAGIIYFFENTGELGWLYSWIIFTLFQLLLMYLAPAVIMPLFNKFSPLPEGDLRTAIEKYAATRKFQLSGIFTMDSSKRSTKSNAFFTGFGRFRRLVLFDTLIKIQTQEELVSILAHEIGHFERKHIQKSLVISILSTGFFFYTFAIFKNNPGLFAAFRMEQTSVYASLVFTGFLFSPISKIISIFTQMLSRKYEFEADAFACETYGDPTTLISALKKLSLDHLSHLTPHPLKVLLDYSHPPILERIRVHRQLPGGNRRNQTGERRAAAPA